MFEQIKLSPPNPPVTRREVTSVLGKGRNPLPSIAKAQALLKGHLPSVAHAVPNLTQLHPNGSGPGGDYSPRSEARTKTAVGGAHLIVGATVKLKCAEILDCDTLIVEGLVEANMDSRILIISEGGRMTGQVNVDVAEIHGHFEGELNASAQLIIHARGHVSGKVRYGQLFVGQGGELRGDADTSPGITAESPPRPQLKAVTGEARRHG